jgi:GAF domain-containing protein
VPDGDADASPTAITNEVVEATRRVLGADRVSVLDVVPSGEELEVRLSSPAIDRRVAVPFGSRSFAGYVALAAQVVVVDDTSLDQRFDSTAGCPTVSAVGAPIFAAGRLHGVLIAESSAANQFDHNAVSFIQGMANVVGAALQC